MGEDVLRYVSSPILASIVDQLLLLYTHRSHVLRRGSWATTLLLYICTIHVVLLLRSYLNVSRPVLPTNWEIEDAKAANYTPLPPTPQQQANYVKLVDIINNRQSGLPTASFSANALENERSKVVGVTAIVLHWKRKKGLDLVVKHISKYPFIREIIVWNNRPGIDLTEDDFELSSPFSSDSSNDIGPPTLRIFNSPGNVHDAGKHFACSLATYSHCYFNDDDWLNVYMDALYTKYLECCAGGGGVSRGESGGKIASNTMPIIHLEHRRWRYEDLDIDLHTGFTWLGTGAFAPRHLSVQFLNQQSAVPDILTQDQTRVSDMFFSLWTNSYPEQMPNDLVPIDVEGGEVGWSREGNVDQWAAVYGNTLDAVRKLSTVLLMDESYLCPDPFPLIPPRPESHTRAPCANDGCLFSTSLTPFPSPSSLKYDVAPLPGSVWSFFSVLGWNNKASGVELEQRFDPWAIRHVRDHEKKWNEVEEGWPTDDWWVRVGSWHLAVDGKGVETCWESWRPPEGGDHFGLTLVAPRVVSQIKIVGSHDLAHVVAWEEHSPDEESWELYTSREDGSGGWEPRNLEAYPQVKPLAPSRIRVTLQLEPQRADAQGKPIAIRKIKLISRGHKRWKLAICQWELDGWTI